MLLSQSFPYSFKLNNSDNCAIPGRMIISINVHDMTYFHSVSNEVTTPWIKLWRQTCFLSTLAIRSTEKPNWTPWHPSSHLHHLHAASSLLISPHDWWSLCWPPVCIPRDRQSVLFGHQTTASILHILQYFYVLCNMNQPDFYCSMGQFRTSEGHKHL